MKYLTGKSFENWTKRKQIFLMQKKLKTIKGLKISMNINQIIAPPKGYLSYVKQHCFVSCMYKTYLQFSYIYLYCLDIDIERIKIEMIAW